MKFENIKRKILESSRVFKGVMKQAAIPIAASLLWAAFITLQNSPWIWTTFINTSISTLAILSILSSQWHRVSKQIKDRDSFKEINVKIDDLGSILKSLKSIKPTNTVINKSTVTQTTNIEQNTKSHVHFTATDYMRESRKLLNAGQNYVAMWMAAMAFEHALRSVSQKIDMQFEPLHRIISKVSQENITKINHKELILLSRMRNNLAHPHNKNSYSSELDDTLEAEQVVNEFERAVISLLNLESEATLQEAA